MTYPGDWKKYLQQERPLGQRKTLPSHKLPYMTFTIGIYRCPSQGYLPNEQLPYYSKSQWHWINPFKFNPSRKVKFDSVIGLPIYGFLLLFNSNIGPK